MKSFLDSRSIEIPCPSCGNKISQTIAQLKADTQFTCPKCKTTIKPNGAKLRDGEFAKLNKSLTKLF